MEYTDIIYLLSNEIKEDDIGNMSSSNISTSKCYAKKQSVKSNEFYNAIAVGINPTVEFIIKRLNYSGETFLKYNNEVYSIVRTADPKNKFDIVLVCSKKIGVK
ncbi:MAG: phage head closure protein [Tenericutes bacterium]|nr:phage head closure protein [Mycoplasmatota bacterium]